VKLKRTENVVNGNEVIETEMEAQLCKTF